MVWSSFALGNRPYAPPTRQTVHKLVTSGLQTSFSIPFYFNRLRTLCALQKSVSPATPLQSNRFALFVKNPGVVHPQKFTSCFQGLTHSSRIGLPRPRPCRGDSTRRRRFFSLHGSSVTGERLAYRRSACRLKVGRWGRRSRWGGRGKYGDPPRRPGLRGWCSLPLRRWRRRHASRREWSG